MSGPGNHTGEGGTGWTDRQVGQVRDGWWVVTNYISAFNWGEGMSTKAGVDLEEVGMKVFSEGWAGLERTTMKV